MNAKQFQHEAVHGGYALSDVTKSYMKSHQPPYTQDDIYAVYRLQEYCNMRDAKEITDILCAQESEDTNA